jgi:hypothetical protein
LLFVLLDADEYASYFFLLWEYERVRVFVFCGGTCDVFD